MKNPFRRFFTKAREGKQDQAGKTDCKGKTKEAEKEFLLSCDFGYDITSPIPSVEPVHKNFHCVIPAVVGTVVKPFPEEGYEVVEFVSGITDEDGRTIGLKCRLRQDPRIIRYFNIPDDPMWETDLICDKAVLLENNKYENGKNTHTYRRLLLTEK